VEVHSASHSMEGVETEFSDVKHEHWDNQCL
jgi:hypothetical protein